MWLTLDAAKAEGRRAHRDQFPEDLGEDWTAGWRCRWLERRFYWSAIFWEGGFIGESDGFIGESDGFIGESDGFIGESDSAIAPI
jgi:hypothetical protein